MSVVQAFRDIDMFNLKDKKVVITGAAQGNGAAFAVGFAKLGAIVILADFNFAQLKDVQQQIVDTGGRVSIYPLNIADQEQCFAFAEKVKKDVGDIDILINNAGILRRSNLESESTFKDLEDTLNVNVKGSYYLCYAFLASLKQTKGNIINIASIQSFVAATTATTYAISKGAVAQMTKTLAAELAKYGIRVNAIAPGIIATPMTEYTQSHQNILDSYLVHVPMKRLGQSNELVGPVVFLSSDAASYVTGCILPVDGGYLTV